jgi:hypothetical protein
MRLFLLGLALAALPATGEPRVIRLAPITLYAHFLQQDPPPAVLEAMQDELAEIMAPAGVELEWRSVSTAKSAEVSVELAVVTFRGECEATDAEFPIMPIPGALGWTHISDGAILPFSEIDCDGIRRFLHLDLVRLRQQERDAAYGRAVGRVLAHELYHIFANTQAHGSEGIAKRSYTARELISPALQFEERESDALREGTARARMEAPAADGQ